jgi:hypothetical protein
LEPLEGGGDGDQVEHEDGIADAGHAGVDGDLADAGVGGVERQAAERSGGDGAGGAWVGSAAGRL